MENSRSIAHWVALPLKKLYTEQSLGHHFSD